MIGPDFQTKTIETLLVRAGQRCSNPDCDVLTAGPHTAENKRLIIGEAAHIFGARPSERRYRSEMTDPERAAISNGIWLCRNCHKEVDSDPLRFPADLLVEWKRTHENKIRSSIGTVGEKIRNDILEKELEKYGEIPSIAKEIIRDHPKYWEYMLSAEVFDYYTKAPMRRARDLELGRIVRPMKSLDPELFSTWFKERPNELALGARAAVGLVEDLQNAWGAPGEPGNAEEIIHVCRLWGDLANFFVTAAEEVRFTTVPDGFEGVRDLLSKAAVYSLKHFPELSSFLRNTITNQTRGGVFEFQLVMELPKGWDDDYANELERGLAAVAERGSRW